MARSLADIVGKNKKGLVKGPGGVLSEEEQPDLQGLTGQAGLPAAPTTAVGGAMIGATPQQQKMMGSSAQLQNALRMSAEGAETLEGARQLRQARTATTAEQEKMARAEELSGLSSAEKTAKALIDKEKQKLAPAAGATTLAPTPAPEAMVVEEAPTGLNLTADAFAAVRPLIVNALTDIQAGKPIPPETMAQINNALGKPIDSPVDENTLKQFLVESKDLIKQQGADAVANNLFVSDLLEEEGFGYTAPQLADLLGVDEETLKKTAIGDLDLLIKNAQAQTFATVTGARQALQSGLVGQAEAEALRGTIREASETGIAATEEDFQKLDDALERADIITFGGKQMTVGDALKDETISQFISDYISATPEKKKEMEAQEPALTTFVKNNQAVFDAANEGFKAGAKEFKGIQDKNKSYTENFPPQLLDAIFPDWNKPSATDISKADVTMFKYFNSLKPDVQKRVKDNLTTAINDYPELAKELKYLTADELKQLNLDKSGYSNLQKYIDGRKRYTEIQNIDPDNIDQIIQQLAGADEDAVGLTAKKIQKALDDNAKLRLLGLPGSDLRIFDDDGDGKLDNIKSLYQRLKKNSAVSGLSSYLKKDQPQYKNLVKWRLPNYNTAAGEAGASGTILLDKLSKEMKDGKLTPDEILKNKKLTITDIGQLVEAEDWGNLSVQVRTALTEKAKNLRTASFDNDVRNVFEKDLVELYNNPAMQEQITNPDLFRQGIKEWNSTQWIPVLEQDMALKSRMVDALTALIDQQSKLTFPTMDVDRLRLYRDNISSMIQMAKDQKAYLEKMDIEATRQLARERDRNLDPNQPFIFED